jgi:hypothetical protein
VPEKEKEVKYEYFRQEVESALSLLEEGKPDPNQYPGLFAYHLLGVAYKLDYLILPEGFILDVLEKIHSAYINKSQSPPQVRLKQVVKEFHRLHSRTKEEVQAEIYRTSSTFGVAPPLPHSSVSALIDKELPNMEWPLANGHESWQRPFRCTSSVICFSIMHRRRPTGNYSICTSGWPRMTILPDWGSVAPVGTVRGARTNGQFVRRQTGFRAHTPVNIRN